MAKTLKMPKDNINLLYKGCLTSVKDVDSKKGIVVFYASVFNVPDRVRDIVEPQAFDDTLKNDKNQIQHYKNHDPTQMPGVIQEIETDSYGLKVTSQLILDTVVGAETFSQYKAMAAAGKSMSHSFGYYVQDEQPGDDSYNHLLKLKLLEVSSLTCRPAHPGAMQVSVKSLDELLKDEAYYNELLKSDFSDFELLKLESIKNHISDVILSRQKAEKPTTLDIHFNI